MQHPRHVLFVFLDGVGLGEADHKQNPFSELHLPAFERLAGGQPWTANARSVHEHDHAFIPIDATLGMLGFPQSGTGQASLFTGVNCAALAGKHFGPFPHSATRPALKAHNIFRQICTLGLPFVEPAGFANAYPPRFFAIMSEQDRWTVTTRCCLDAGLPIRDERTLLQERALAANITGAGFPASLNTPVISEEEAGERLARLSREHAFLLFEYYLTDKAGHSRSAEQAALTLTSLDRFFGALLPALSDDTLLIVTSDHGNIEDLSVKTHTLNPVPLVAVGPGAARFHDVRDLTGVVPAVVDVLARHYGIPVNEQGAASRALHLSL